MHGYQFNQLISVLNTISENLAEISGNLSIIASEGLSQSDKAALSVLNGMLADGDYTNVEKLIDSARDIGNEFMLGSDG
jgi:hypothetical protein